MKSEWEPFYVSVVFSEVERFLNDLAGASLSAEYEIRRLNLEKKISTVRKISPPNLKPSAPKTPEQKQPRRLRSWSFPPTLSHESLPEVPEKKRHNSTAEDSVTNKAEGELASSSTSPRDGEEEALQSEGSEILRNRTRFERLRQAYNSTVKSHRQRSASVPHVSIVQQDHRKPNPEYIQLISSLSGFVYKKEKDLERKPNKKGFNVVWRCAEDER